MENAEYAWTKEVLRALDHMAYELEELRAYKEDSELWISGLRQDANDALER